jgi:hypothetical protein
MKEQFVFTSSPLELDDLACLRYLGTKSRDPAYSDFTLTTLRCRQLVFEFPGQLVACPRTQDCAVLVVRQEV